MAQRTIGQNRLLSPRSIVVGTGDGADYKISTSDDASVKILTAINDARTNNIRCVEFRPGTYNFATTLVIPKDPYVTLRGTRNPKDSLGTHGTVFKMAASQTYMINMSGDSSSTANSNLSHDLQISDIAFDGNSLCTNVLYAKNIDFLYMDRLRILNGTQDQILVEYNGTLPPDNSSVQGGIYLLNSTIAAPASYSAAYLQYVTQSWINSNWFEGSASCHSHVRIKSSNKVKITSGNEFNSCTRAVYFEDTAATACQNNILSGNIYACSVPYDYSFSNSDSNFFVRNRKIRSGYITPALSPFTISEADSDQTFLTSGGAGVTFNLPNVKAGVRLTIFAGVAQVITVHPQSGDQIFGKATGADMVSAGTAGDKLVLEGIDDFYWLPISNTNFS